MHGTKNIENDAFLPMKGRAEINIPDGRKKEAYPPFYAGNPT